MMTDKDKCIAELEADLAAAKAENYRLMDEWEAFDCGIASALGWECEGEPWVECIRGYRMAHEIERAENARLKEVCKPFSHPDLSRIMGGNAKGDDSIVFQRNDAILRIGDFKAAAEAAKEKK